MRHLPVVGILLAANVIGALLIAAAGPVRFRIDRLLFAGKKDKGHK